MKTKAKSTEVYELRIFDLEYFHDKKPTQANNIYHGFIVNCKTKKKIFFHTPAQFISAFEKLQKKE